MPDHLPAQQPGKIYLPVEYQIFPHLCDLYLLLNSRNLFLPQRQGLVRLFLDRLPKLPSHCDLQKHPVLFESPGPILVQFPSNGPPGINLWEVWQQPQIGRFLQSGVLLSGYKLQ